jgi:isochorismate synthase EntC
MTLFAGGGLVEGSEEAPELAETELKLAPMLTALGHRSS